MFLAAVATLALFAQRPPHRFEVSGGKFLLDGSPYQILAGEIHPSRVPHQLWRDRIRMARAMGLNTISAYLFWNEHEPEPGHFVFTGDQDAAKFVRICQEEGMYVLLRPGPYVCAEWDFGGFPYWLLTRKDLVLRSDNPAFLNAAASYLKAVSAQLAPLQITRGGNILMVQVENEYGSYGHDKTYMTKAREMLKEVGFDVPLYVAEGGSQLADAWVPGTVAGVNGAGWPEVMKVADRYTPGGPYMVPEFYPGWLDHWGEPKSVTDGDVAAYQELIRHGVSVNLYMFHGGTNFGFMNGANYGDHYQPDITSYDYDAPLNEYGAPTPKYFKFRTAIQETTGRTLPAVPNPPKTVSVAPFPLSRCGSLLGTLPRPTHSMVPKSMEDLGQAYGFVLYETYVSHAGPAHLELGQVRDYAVVMLNGKVARILDRRNGDHGCDLQLPSAPAKLDILVENCGRINYGGKLPDNRQGLIQEVLLDGVPAVGWTTYSLPMNSTAGLKLDGKNEGPTFYSGAFQLNDLGETFLDLRNWNKGVAWVNGHSLGRYWRIGPQQTLYVPSVWLRKGLNHVLVFDEAGVKSPKLQTLDHPVLNDLMPVPEASTR